MYYSYEGDNEDLKTYLEDNGYVLLYSSDENLIYVVKRYNNKNYQKSLSIDVTIKDSELQFFIARFVKSSIIEIECEIIEDELTLKKQMLQSKTRSRLFKELEYLGVKSKANYSEKELLSWEREYRRIENEEHRLAQYEQMGR